MNIAFRRLCPWAVVLTLASLAGVASAQAPLSELDKQLSRIDLGVSGMGYFTRASSGKDDLLGNVVTDTPGNTLGALVSVRYIVKPLVGFEFNYNYARNVQTYTGTTIASGALNPLGVQVNASEYSLGYVVHTPRLFGIGTFVSGGAGSTAFRPSKGGGQGFQPQARATYYYNAGIEDSFLSPHFGLRASFRQAFYLAPDFETNYLRNHQRTFTTEPTVGFFLRF